MWSLAFSSVGIKSAICKHTSFINMPIGIFEAGGFFSSDLFHPSPGWFGLLLLWFSIQTISTGNFSQDVMTHRGGKKNRLKFNHSHTQILFFCYLFLIMCQQDVFISRNLIFSLTFLHYTRQGFFKLLCNVGSAVTRIVFNCMCSTLNSYDFQTE